MKLFLWKLSQDENNGYDTFDSAVVVATDPVNASMVHPSRYSDTGAAIFTFDKVDDCWRRIDDGYSDDGGWARPNDIKVVCLGVCGSTFLREGDVVCRSFNAG